MIGGEPNPTAYDLRFSVIGVPVRVSIWFWLGCLLFGHGLLVGEKAGLYAIMWIGTCLVSITLHELGHSLAFRRFGIPSRIVLHAFGGLAIPDTYSNPWQVTTRRTAPQQQIIISAAGPLIQILFAMIIIGSLWLAGYDVPAPNFIARILPTHPNPRWLPYDAWLLASMVLLVNVYWPLINLMPVYPLDGGQIARSLFLMNDASQPIRNSLMLSMIVGGMLAVYGMSSQQIFIAYLFGMLALSNYQMVQMHGGGGGGGFGRW